MTSRLAAREPALEWSRRSAAEEVEDLSWVDADLDPDRPTFVQREQHGGERTFRHLPYTAFLPPPVAEAAQEAQRRGQATLHEALLLLYARIEWLMASRQYLWSPLSPMPKLLAHMAEAFGVGAELHRNRGDSLARLVAILPRWHPHRGTVAKALEVVEALDGDDAEPLLLAHADEDGAAPDLPNLRDEVFRCREGDWWKRRGQEGAALHLRMEEGLLRFQPEEGPVFELQREDVLIDWDGENPLPKHLMRLLPAWAEFRLVVARNS